MSVKKFFSKFMCLINDTVGRHSVYTRPVFTGTIDFDTLIERALDKTGYEESMAHAIFREVKKEVQKYLIMGYRIELGERFLTLYPNKICSVKDYTDKDGNLIVADEKMIKANDGKSRIGCTVHPDFSKEFSDSVVWKKVKNGVVVDDDDATEGNENINGTDNTQTIDSSTGTVDTSTGSNNNGGDDIPAGNG